MTCQSFLQGFSEYRDGVADPAFRRAAEDHLRSCPDCRRYREVVERGLEVLRDTCGPQLLADFEARLRHRLFHVDEEEALHRHVTSAATGFSVLGVALLLSAVAWSPVLWPAEPEVELSPIVVSRAPNPLGLRPAWLAAPPPSGAARFAGDAELWDDAHTLLFQHSSLSQHSQQRARLRRTGVHEDR